MAKYEDDVVAWSNEQAHLLRTGQLSALDVEHIADEIEDVGKSARRELVNRMAVLLAHLLKWLYLPERRCSGWEAIIHTQRRSIARRLTKMPSLKASLVDTDLWADAWGDAIAAASSETGMSYSDFPDSCPWGVEDVMEQNFFPGAGQAVETLAEEEFFVRGRAIAKAADHGELLEFIKAAGDQPESEPGES